MTNFFTLPPNVYWAKLSTLNFSTFAGGRPIKKETPTVVFRTLPEDCSKNKVFSHL